MRILITAGPTHEPIDPVRYIGNHSSGRMGLAITNAALAAGHSVTLILGPITLSPPPAARRIDVQTAAQMHQAVLAEFPHHDLLIMAAAVADFRPTQIASDKIARAGKLIIECEPTADIVADAARQKRPDQRVISFSLESSPDLARVREKLLRKNVDLSIYNPTQTLNSQQVSATLVYPDGHTQALPDLDKADFAHRLIQAAQELFFR